MATIKQRLQLLFTKEDFNRIEIKENGDVTLDLHGLNVPTAKRLINNVIVINREQFTMELIHGYNRGTALKQMIQSDINNNRIINKQTSDYNLGLTQLRIAGVI